MHRWRWHPPPTSGFRSSLQQVRWVLTGKKSKATDPWSFPLRNTKVTAMSKPWLLDIPQPLGNQPFTTEIGLGRLLTMRLLGPLSGTERLSGGMLRTWPLLRRQAYPHVRIGARIGRPRGFIQWFVFLSRGRNGAPVYLRDSLTASLNLSTVWWCSWLITLLF